MGALSRITSRGPWQDALWALPASDLPTMCHSFLLQSSIVHKLHNETMGRRKLQACKLDLHPKLFHLERKIAQICLLKTGLALEGLSDGLRNRPSQPSAITLSLKRTIPQQTR